MTTLQFTGTDFIMGNGFSTENRYIRQPANSADADFAMTEGQSFTVSWDADDASDRDVNWRFQCGALNMVGSSPNVAPPPATGVTSRDIAI